MIVIGKDLNDAWRNTMWECVKHGYNYTVKKGSYEGQIRKQLQHLMIIVEEPYKRPFKFYTPPTIPEPTDEAKIHQYFYDYLITDTKCDHEDYTYGEMISLQINDVIQILNDSQGHTNQACMNIGGVDNIKMDDPPCLRVVDFKVVEGKLNVNVFFRSWDLFTGLPENLGGIQLLKEYVSLHLNFPHEDGKLIAYSSGAHLYEMYFPIVNALNTTQIEIKE